MYSNRPLRVEPLFPGHCLPAPSRPGLLRVRPLPGGPHRNWQSVQASVSSVRIEPVPPGCSLRDQGRRVRVWTLPGWYHRRRDHVQRYFPASLELHYTFLRHNFNYKLLHPHTLSRTSNYPVFFNKLLAKFFKIVNESLKK